LSLVFGPVMTFTKFDTEEAIRMANESDYDLGGYIYTHDLKRTHQVTSAIRTGNLWVNSFMGLPHEIEIEELCARASVGVVSKQGACD
jgi:acyl-CoA reductase-like NAD-dependent aldehyde dehydrogenase